MPTINVNTAVSLPAGALLMFKAGGSGRAIDGVGNIYTIGLSDMQIGPFSKAQTVQIQVTNAPITYAVETDGVPFNPVEQDPYTRQLVTADGQVVGGGFIEAGVIGGLSLRRRATMYDVHNAATPEAALNALNAFVATAADPASSVTGTEFQNIVYVDPAAATGGTGEINSPRNVPPVSANGMTLPANTAILIRGGRTIQRNQMFIIEGTATGGNQADGQAIRTANTYIGGYYTEEYGLPVIDFSDVPPDPSANDTVTVRGMRISARNVTLADIEMRPPIATTGVKTGGGTTTVTQQSTFTVDGQGAGFRARGLRLHRPIDVPVINRGISLNGCPFQIIEGCEFTGYWMNPIAFADVVQELLDAETRISRIRNNILRCGTLQKSVYSDADCLTMAGSRTVSGLGVPTNWNYKIVISGNKMLGARENACDLSRHGQVIVFGNEMLEPTTDPAPGVVPCAMLGGTSTSQLTARSSGSVVIGNIIRGWNLPEYAAINTRGGRRMYIIGNIIDDCWRGIGGSTADTPDTYVLHNTIVNIGTGGAFRSSLASNTGWRVLNNIMHGQRIWSLSSTSGTGGLRGGNLISGGIASDRDLIGSDSGVPWVTGTQIAPDHWFASLDQMIDPRTYEPTRAAMMKTIAQLEAPVRDALLSEFRYQCAGAVAPAQVW